MTQISYTVKHKRSLMGLFRSMLLNVGVRHRELRVPHLGIMILVCLLLFVTSAGLQPSNAAVFSGAQDGCLSTNFARRSLPLQFHQIIHIDNRIPRSPHDGGVRLRYLPRRAFQLCRTDDSQGGRTRSLGNRDSQF